MQSLGVWIQIGIYHISESTPQLQNSRGIETEQPTHGIPGHDDHGGKDRDETTSSRNNLDAIISILNLMGEMSI